MLNFLIIFQNNSQIEERSVPNENATPDPPVYGDWLQSFSASFPDKVDSNKNSENFYLSSAATGSIDSIENILTKKYFSNFNSASASRHVIDTPCDTSSRCDRMVSFTWLKKKEIFFFIKLHFLNNNENIIYRLK